MSQLPISVVDGRLALLQSNQLRLADNPDANNSTTVGDASGFVDQTFERLTSTDEFVEYQVSFAYDIEPGDFGVALRLGTAQEGETEITLTVDGEGFTGSFFRLEDEVLWTTFGTFGDELSSGFEAGDTLTIRVEYVSGNATQLDLITVYDTRYNYNFSNAIDANDQLPGPELFPDADSKQLQDTTTRRDVTEASLTSSWVDNDVSNNQFIELSIGAETQRTDNSTTASISVGDANAETIVGVMFGLSRYGSRTDATPTEGFLGHAVESFELFGNPDAITKDDIGQANVRAIIPESDALTETFAESGLLDSSNTLLTSCRVPEFQKDEHLVISSERLRFDND